MTRSSCRLLSAASNGPQADTHNLSLNKALKDVCIDPLVKVELCHHVLADRLAAVRRRRFIGRTAELALFETAIAAEELPFFVLYVHGPGGLGKTSLLSQFARLAGKARHRPIPSIRGISSRRPKHLQQGCVWRWASIPPPRRPTRWPPGQAATSSWSIPTSCYRHWTAGCATSFCPSFPSGCWWSWPAATHRPLPGEPTRAGSPSCVRCPCATSAPKRVVTI